jgi:nucleoside-diphosphate-sugar epimerase
MSFEGCTIAVTGSTGFVGRAVCRALLAKGAAVRSLVRYRSEVPGEFLFDLSQSNIDPRALQGPVRAVVHCAWDLTPSDTESARGINAEGSQWLIEKCVAAGVEQFVFISSMASHAQARSAYGTTKWEIENRLMGVANAKDFGTIIAPGTVIGGGGVFEKARQLIRKLPVVPVFYSTGGRRIQTVHIDDLCDAILASIERKITGRLNIADPWGVKPMDFYRGLAMLEGRRVLRLPFPGDLALSVVRGLEAMGKKPAVSSSNLLGLKMLKYFNPRPSLLKLGLATLPDYWRSLQRLAESQGLEKIAGKLGRVITR